LSSRGLYGSTLACNKTLFSLAKTDSDRTGTQNFFSDDLNATTTAGGSFQFRVDRIGGGFVNPLGSYGDGSIIYYSVGATIDWTGLNATNTPITALYQSGATTTLDIIRTRCSESSNVFSSALCASFTFLFIPDPEILNNYVALPDTLALKFPFSWYYGIKNTYDGLTASSSANMASVGINFASVDPATSTPFGPILPNANVLSSTTISTYLTPTMLATLLALETAAIWVIFSLFIFHDVQRRWLRH